MKLHKVRHDCADLFWLKLLPEPSTPADEFSYDMTPCLVRLPAPVGDAEVDALARILWDADTYEDTENEYPAKKVWTELDQETREALYVQARGVMAFLKLPVAEQWYIARHPYQLLELPDETEVLCPWPGAKRCDVFRFTVGEFRQAWEAAAAVAREQKGGAS